MNRYFIIYFSGITEDNNLRNGRIEYSTSDGRFFNEEASILYIEGNFNLRSVFIKDFKELSERDFMDYIDGRGQLPDSLGDEIDFL